MTSQQLLNAIRFKITFGIGVPVPPNTYENYIAWEDFEDYAALLNPGETVKTLIHVQTQVGTTVYKSGGYDADDFTTSENIANNPSAQVELPDAANQEPVEGVYKITVKAKFDDGVSPFTVTKVINSLPLCLDDEPTATLELSYDCQDATFTSSDTTSYGNDKYSVESIVREHTVFPPAVSGRAEVTVDSPTNIETNLWNYVTYEAELLSTVTYKKDDNYFIFYVTATAEQRVECDDALCRLYCLLNKIRTQYYSYLGKNPTNEKIYFQKLLLGTHEYFMAVQAREGCSDDEDKHISKFYEVTELDPDCECGCPEGTGDGKAAPVVPSGGGAGAQGPVGPQGDPGPQGAQGDPGADGLRNYELVENDLTQVVTTAAAKAGNETLYSQSFDMQADEIALNTSGSYVKVMAAFTFPTGKTSTGKYVTLKVGAYAVIHSIGDTTAIPNPTIILEMEFHRKAAAAQNKAIFTVTHSGGTFKIYSPATALNFGAAFTVEALGRITDAAADDNEIRLEQVMIEKFFKIT